jgi:hypothetical protein
MPSASAQPPFLDASVADALLQRVAGITQTAAYAGTAGMRRQLLDVTAMAGGYGGLDRQAEVVAEMQAVKGLCDSLGVVRATKDVHGGVAQAVADLKGMQEHYGGVASAVAGLQEMQERHGGIVKQVEAITEAQRAKGLHDAVAGIKSVTERYAGITKAWDGMAGAGLARQMDVVQAAQAWAKPFQEVYGVAAVAERMGLAYVRSPLAAKGFWPADALSPLLGTARAVDAARLYGVASVAPPLAERWAEAQEREERMSDAVEAFANRWEGHALWFIFSTLSVEQVYRLARLGSREEVEAVLLDALEAVLTGSAFTAALSAALRNAPAYVCTDQRDDMRQGLEHVQRGELSRAVPPLMVGLEGAFWSAGREHDVIDEERRLLAKPSKGVISRVDYVVRGLPATQEFRTFVCSRVFGDVGHPVRHGEQSDRRRQALFAVVGIAGWVDAFMGLRTRQALVRLLHDELASRTA